MLVIKGQYIFKSFHSKQGDNATMAQAVTESERDWEDFSEEK